MSITQREFCFLSSDGITKVYATAYEDTAASPIAIVQICHGMCEYIERYRPFAEYLVAHGFLVVGHDQLGHGRTVSPRGFGFFSDHAGSDRLIEDCHRLMHIVHEQHPDLPFFLLGHSMGSMVVENVVSRYHDKFLTGVLLSGTRGPDRSARGLIALLSILILFLGRPHRGEFLSSLAFIGFNKRFAPAKTKFEWLTRRTEVVTEYIRDPLCRFPFTLGGLRDILRLSLKVSDDLWPMSIPDELPFLFFSGSDDPVGFYGKGVHELAQRLTDSGVQDVSVQIYPGGRHEMLNEINRDDVFADILSWLNLHLQSPEKPL